jgi:hypothetical protein
MHIEGNQKAHMVDVVDLVDLVDLVELHKVLFFGCKNGPESHIQYDIGEETNENFGIIT